MINFKRAILGNRSNLIAGFENAIRISMHEAYKRSKSTPQEPDFIAMLMLEGIPYISNCLQSILKPMGLKTTVSSVFCHQRPEVTFSSSPKGCELGDILVVHRHKNSRGDIRNNSLLLQAKMSSDSVLRISSSDELNQLNLYQNWPQFTYKRSGPLLNGQIRNILPKMSHHGAQYLLIDDSGYKPWSGILGFPSTHCMAVWPAENPLFADYSLSEALFHFISGFNGRIFTESPKNDPTGWSEVVWDLLRHSVTSAFNRKNIQVQQNSRSGGNLMVSSITKNYFYSSEFGSKIKNGDEAEKYLNQKLTSWGGGSNEPPNSEEFDDNQPPSGVSLLLIETEDSE